MKKIVPLLIVLSFCMNLSLYGQPTGDPSQPPPPQPTEERNWQNWTFAGSAVVAAALGIFLITIGQGESNPKK